MSQLPQRSAEDLNRRLELLGQQVGHTPLHEFHRIWNHPTVRVMAKLEWMQLGGSIKARAAFNIIRAAIQRGDYGQGQTLIDATSGNTGIAYASVAATLNLPVHICLPGSASEERMAIMRQLGAHLEITPADRGVDGAQARVRELYEQHPEAYFLADQYANDDNWRAHYLTTAPEIWAQTSQSLTHFVSAIGTSGTQMGMGRWLADHAPHVRRVALQPDRGDHTFEGWKHLATTGRIPPIYDGQVPDDFVAVSNQEADAMVARLAREEGLLVSPSAAGNLVGALKLARTLSSGVVVTTFADDFSKYSADYARIFPAGHVA